MGNNFSAVCLDGRGLKSDSRKKKPICLVVLLYTTSLTKGDSKVEILLNLELKLLKSLSCRNKLLLKKTA